jgi:hypothetical protein
MFGGSSLQPDQRSLPLGVGLQPKAGAALLVVGDDGLAVDRRAGGVSHDCGDQGGAGNGVQEVRTSHQRASPEGWAHGKDHRESGVYGRRIGSIGWGRRETVPYGLISSAPPPAPRWPKGCG